MPAHNDFLAHLPDLLNDLARKVELINNSQDTLLINGHSLQDQLERLHGAITHLIEFLTQAPKTPQGKSISELLAQFIAIQTETNNLLKRNTELVVEILQSLQAPARATIAKG
jgi:ABC-type transporter Mla subunit MlaD